MTRSAHVQNVLLILEKTSAGRVYGLGRRPSPLEPSIESTDRSTGLLFAARKADLVITNRTALAVIKYVENLGDADRAPVGSAIALAATDKNFSLIGALLVVLGFADGLPVSGEAAYWVTAGLTDALKAMPRAATEQELATLKRWAAKPLAPTDAPPIVAAAVQSTGRGVGLVTRVNEPRARLREAIRDIERFRLIETVLNDASPIVDRDRRELLEHLKKLKVNQAVLDLLTDADRNAVNADYKAAIEKLRTFLERVYEECCRRSPAAQAFLPPKSGGNIKPWIDCARDAGLISKYEYAVVQSLSSFQAMEATHAAKSEPRQYSVAKASVIEWCLLLADRVR